MEIAWHTYSEELLARIIVRKLSNNEVTFRSCEMGAEYRSFDWQSKRAVEPSANTIAIEVGLEWNQS